MAVLAAPTAGAVGLALTNTGDVDEHSVVGIDPAGVNDVASIATHEVDVVGVHVEEVRLGVDGRGVVGIGGVVGVLGVVEVVA